MSRGVCTVCFSVRVGVRVVVWLMVCRSHAVLPPIEVYVPEIMCAEDGWVTSYRTFFSTDCRFSHVTGRVQAHHVLPVRLKSTSFAFAPQMSRSPPRCDAHESWPRSLSTAKWSRRSRLRFRGLTSPRRRVDELSQKRGFEVQTERGDRCRLQRKRN